MTPQEHNKFVGTAHIVYASFYLLLGVVFAIFFAVMFTSFPEPGRAGTPAVFGIFFALIFFVFYGVLTVPSLIAGIALLKQKSWAKTASIIAAVLAGMQFPIGTAVCIYSFWFLFSEPGKVLYERPQLPPPAPPNWGQTATTQCETNYIPRTPPDWR